MKLVINALSARTGGGLTYLRNLLAVDPPGDVQVHVLVLPGTELPRLSKGVRVHQLPASLGNPFVRMAWERLRLPTVLRRLGAEVLFCPGGTIGLRPPSGCRTVTMFRNMLPFDRAQRSRYPLGYTRARTTLLEPVLLRSMRKADLVIFVSRHALEVLEPRLNDYPGTRIVIPHGVSDDFRAAARRSLPKWLPLAGYLLYVSNFEPYKRQLEVVQAFQRLQHRRPGMEKLVLVGPASSAAYTASVKAEVARWRLETEVVINHEVGHANLPAVYQHATVGIFASECENCPNVLLEAMAAGRPLVVSNRPPMPEFAGSSALYFDPTDPTELAERLHQVLRDPDRRRRMGAIAASEALKFDWNKTAERTWQALSDVLVRA